MYKILLEVRWPLRAEADGTHLSIVPTVHAIASDTACYMVLLTPGRSVLYVTIPLIFVPFIRWRLTKKPSRKGLNIETWVVIKSLKRQRKGKTRESPVLWLQITNQQSPVQRSSLQLLTRGRETLLPNCPSADFTATPHQKLCEQAVEQRGSPASGFIHICRSSCPDAPLQKSGSGVPSPSVF